MTAVPQVRRVRARKLGPGVTVWTWGRWVRIETIGPDNADLMRDGKSWCYTGRGRGDDDSLVDLELYDDAHGYPVRETPSTEGWPLCPPDPASTASTSAEARNALSLKCSATDTEPPNSRLPQRDTATALTPPGRSANTRSG